MRTTKLGTRREADRELVIVADDNADMREYVSRLLSDQYRVHTVPNGLEALKAVETLKPDLVLADVMMPELDGFSLLRSIRARSGTIPVILLSARAGEESRVEGLESGADDYLVKPFAARELLARVKSTIELSRIRRKASESERKLRAEAELERTRLRELFMNVPAAIAMLSGPEHRWTFVNHAYIRATGRNGPEDFIGKTIRESMRELEVQVFFDLLDNVYRTGTPYFGTEMKAVLDRAATQQGREGYFNFVYQPIRNTSGEVEGILVHAVEVTEQVLARRTH